MNLPSKTVETIEAIINNHGIAEVKVEKDNVVVIDITRKVKSRESI